MTLINGLLAFGGLAFTVPLAIHLFYRSRFRTIEWGAMHLIEGMMRTNRRRIEWTNLVLLLIRCLIPILLAFCLARPLLTGFEALPGDAAQSVIIAIDDSRSMGFATSDGRVRMDDARDAIDRLLDSLNRRDEVILIRSSNPASPITRIGPSSVRASVNATLPQSGPIDLARFIGSATVAAESASEPNPRVIVISDFQTGMITDASLNSLQQIAESVKKQSESDKSRRPSFEFLDIAATDSGDQPANVSIDSISMESAAVVVGRSTAFSAQIRNHGDHPIEGANLVWSVDGRRVPPQPITIPEHSFVAATHAVAFEQAGQVAITASIEFPDSLSADNRRTLALDVIEQIEMWLVDDGNAGRFLEIAMSPFAFSESHLTDPVQATRVTTAELIEKLPDENPNVVALVDVPRPTSRLRRIIGDYVAGGGSLMLFDQADADPSLMNQLWGSETNSFNLPASFGDYVGADSLANSSNGQLFPLAPRNADYSPWSLFGDESSDLFADVQVFGYRQLQLRSESPQANATTLVPLASGDPLIVLSKQGLGRIVQFAIAADSEGSTLPLRPVFVPMMQQMVLDLAGSRQALNSSMGESLTVQTTELIDSESNVDTVFFVATPGKQERSIQPHSTDSVEVLVVANPPRPGVYRFRSTSGKTAIRTVEVQPSESVWRGVDRARLQNAAETIGATVDDQAKSLVDQDRVRRYGREIWRWVLVALLFVMIAELWVSQRVNRQVGRPQMEST